MKFPFSNYKEDSLNKKFYSNKPTIIEDEFTITSEELLNDNNITDLELFKGDTEIALDSGDKALDSGDKARPQKESFNTWILADKFSQYNPNIYYCTDTNEFYIYENLIWKPLKKNPDLKRIIVLWIKNNFKNYLSFQIRKTDEIIDLLQSLNTFSMIESKRVANLNGFLIPYLNGVLNSRTKEFLPHSKDFYLTHLLPFDYNPNVDLNEFKNTNIYKFLNHLCDGNETKLEVLRACLNAIITNDVSYQLSLYLYGPGGTGKSTLVNMLMYILGSEGSFSTTLDKLKSRFSTYSLVNKVLLVLNDIPLVRGKKSDILKIIIASDSIEIEKKYQAPFQFKPNVFVLITSNSLWDIKGATTGLTRRMIYFNITNVPAVKDSSLFYTNALGECDGLLSKDLNLLIKEYNY